MIQIIDYSDTHKSCIKELNYKWLQKYFSIEPIDEIVLSNPKTEIIDKGGKIFYAKYNDAFVGTAALVKINEHTFELAKMAVTEVMQGKGIGMALMKHCLLIARQNKIKKLVLYTNSKLETAIAIYQKFGFQEVDFDASNFKRAKIKMELAL